MAKKILIVDDEPHIAKMLENRIRQAGYETITACDGAEALETARKEKPDLMILDLMLPKLDGYKVCGILKHEQCCARIPIIMFTARAGENDEKLGLEAGADAYLMKPFKSEELMDNIKKLIG